MRAGLIAATLTVLAGAASSPEAAQPAEPPRPRVEQRGWRLGEALGAPSWLHGTLEVRGRLEHIDDDFRAAAPGASTAFMLRSSLSLEVEPSRLTAGVEVMDSRASALASMPLTDTMVNAVELLRAWVGLRVADVFEPGDRAALRLGRLTLDLGSRRFVARNDFRNTVNSFTGVHLEWAGARGAALHAFAVNPMRGAASSSEALVENRVEPDVAQRDTLFWGLFFGSAPGPWAVRVEAFAYGLHEVDGPTGETANRRLVTPGLRLHRAPRPGAFDGQLEAAVQLGHSRASASPRDTSDLAHLAGFLHASAGYQLVGALRPRLSALIDYASGDGDPADGTNGRFDSLFGARRFEFGPTSLFGALNRSNLVSPGLRAEFVPLRGVDTLVGWRAAWLASERDGWSPGALRDATGASGTYLGQQLEGRVRWHALPQNLSLDVGGALFLRGEFAREAPGGRGNSSVYLYAQVTGAM
jgi:hypothetical protein